MAEHRVLLIDLDNCPQELGKLTQRAGCFSRIVVCHGVTSRRVELTTVGQLADVARLGKLEFCAMARGGKNAADFGLAFCAGRLAESMPADTHFWIMSNDSDLDHVVDLLRARGRVADRVGELQTPQNSLQRALEQYKRERLSNTQSRPQRRYKLVSSINRYLGPERQVSGEDVVCEMVRRHMLTVGEDDLIRYHLERERDPDPPVISEPVSVLPTLPDFSTPPPSEPNPEPPPSPRRKTKSADQVEDAELPLFAAMGVISPPDS